MRQTLEQLALSMMTMQELRLYERHGWGFKGKELEKDWLLKDGSVLEFANGRPTMVVQGDNLIVQGPVMVNAGIPKAIAEAPPRRVPETERRIMREKFEQELRYAIRGGMRSRIDRVRHQFGETVRERCPKCASEAHGNYSHDPNPVTNYMMESISIVTLSLDRVAFDEHYMEPDREGRPPKLGRGQYIAFYRGRCPRCDEQLGYQRVIPMEELRG